MSLLTPELLRRLEQFQLLAARRAKSSAKGERRSRARGQSVEFADHRSYVPGDDFRYLDWNLFGRLDRLFLKLYEEERELPVRIFLDASESMTFGEPRVIYSNRRIICNFPGEERFARNVESDFALALHFEGILIAKRRDNKALSSRGKRPGWKKSGRRLLHLDAHCRCAANERVCYSASGEIPMESGL